MWIRNYFLGEFLEIIFIRISGATLNCICSNISLLGVNTSATWELINPLKDNQWVKINTGGIEIDPSIQYRIDFACYDGSANNCISLYRTREKEKIEKEDKKAKPDSSQCADLSMCLMEIH